MKLIYLTGFGLPTGWAHGIQVMKMCEALSALGVDVELVVPRRRNEIKTNPFDYYGVKNNFKIIKLFCLDVYPGDSSSFYFWLRLASFLLVAKFYFLFKKFDVLYTREQAVSLFFNDFILEIHSLSDQIRSWHKKVWEKAQRLVVLTSFIKKRLIEEGIDMNKILVAPDAVDLKEFDISMTKEQLRQELGLPLDKKIIIYAGSLYLHDWKGVDILLESIKYFDQDWILVLVGGEPKEIEKIKEKYGLLAIILAGRQLRQKIPLYLKAADALVLPNKSQDNISKYYTSPLKLFEYMASRQPIIASDLPSIREILNEKNAILFEPDNSESLAFGIKKIFQDNDLARRLANQAWLDTQKYSWSARAKKIIGFING